MTKRFNNPLFKGLACFLFAGALLVAPAWAGESVDSYYGSFGTEVSIAVPPYHEITPDLHVTYSSTTGNGLAGVGWSVAGLSTIERVSAGHGAPKWDSTDVFLLDGQELVPCAGGSTSPSCTTGGTHSTRIENYSRIQLSGSTWYVWDKVGTKRTYSSMFVVPRQVCSLVTHSLWASQWGSCPVVPTCPTGWDQGETVCTQGDFDGEMHAYEYSRTTKCSRTPTQCEGGTVGSTLGTLKYGISSMVDTHNNTVTYGWSCTGTPTSSCVPHTVAYDGTTVTLSYETRPDPVWFATGGGFLGHLDVRLKTIDVSVSGSHARAYAFGYTTTPQGQSSLSSVRQYGTNVTISNGVVTGGSALPAMTVATGAKAASFGGAWSADSTFSNANGFSSSQYYSTLQFADVNGDGKADLCARDSAGAFCNLATGTGFSTARFAGPSLPSPTWDDPKYNSTLRYADINGDGKSDLCVRTSSGIRCYLSTGTQFSGSAITGPAWSDAAGWGSTWYQTIRFADVNGDGKDDICGRDGTSNTCFLSNGSGFPTHVAGPPYASNQDYTTLSLADVNGDHKADFCIRSSFTHNCWLSTGTAFSSTMLDGPEDWFTNGTAQWADVNGDGKADLCGLTAAGFSCTTSTGNGVTGTFGVISEISYATGWSDAQYYKTLRVIDVNQDGRADVCGRDLNGIHCWPATPTGFGASFAGPALSNAAGWSSEMYYLTIELVDTSGDGQPEVCARNSSGLVCYPNAGAAALLKTLANGTGGTTTIGYTPSSAYANTSLPVGMVFPTVTSLTTADGRGSASTVTYGYSGGLYSWAEHRFLGFRRVTSVIDAAGDYTETYYHQHVGCISKPETTYLRDAVGRIYHYSSHTYVENQTPPFTSLLQQRWEYDCALTGTCRSRLTQYGYDVYANATSTTESGDTSVKTRKTTRGYLANTTKYIVARPSYENVYDASGETAVLVKRSVNVYDNQTDSSYAPLAGSVTSVLNWNNVTGAYFTTKHGYDSYGNRTSTTDPLGRTTTFTFDPTYHLYRTSLCNTLGHCSKDDFDFVLGLPKVQTEPNGTTVTATFDAFGRVTKKTRSDGPWESFTYADWGNPSLQRIRHAVSDGTTDGLWADEYFDGLGRTYQQLAESGAIVDTLYLEASKRVWKVSKPHLSTEAAQYTEFAYDGAGRKVRETHPDNSYATVAYGVGTTVITNELGHKTNQWADAFGRLIRVERPYLDGNQRISGVAHEYDVLDHVVKTYDIAHPTSAYTVTYDSLGRKTAECDYDLGCSSATFDANAHLLTHTNKLGAVTMTYDEVGRMKTKTAAGKTTTYTYDETGHGASLGLLTSVSDASGTESFTYTAGKPTTVVKCITRPAPETGSDCRTTSVTYDLAGRRKTTTYPDGEVVTNNFDAAGRLHDIPNYVTSFGYNSAGQLTSATYANGTTEAFTYDPKRDWMLTASVKKATTSLYQATYTYDVGTRVKTMKSSVDANINFTYGYDDLDRLLTVTGAQNQTFAYDPSGNMTSNSALGTYSYKDPAHLHAVTDIGTTHYGYDAAGNLTSGTGPTPFTNSFDVENLMTSTTRASLTTTYTYDWAGHRVQKSNSAGRTTSFNELFEVTKVGSGTPYSTNFIFAGERVIAKKENGVKSWLHQDHLGSVRVATDTSGAVTARYQYTPYGVMSGTSTNGRGFGGHVTDTTGFIYMNARYYDPTIGRFLSADTAIPNLADPQALNRYAYVYNNPVVNTDPTGHVPVVAAFVVALAEGTALAWVAFAVTTVGYLTHDAFLMSVGAIMGGYVADGVWGAVVAGMASPVSPLDPKVKEAIGWAYTAYGLMQSYKAYELEHMTPAEKLQAEWRDYEQRLHAIEPSKPILVASADKAQVVEIIGARLAQPPAPAAGAPMATVSTGVMLVYAQAQVEVPLVTNSKFTYNAGKVCTLGGTCRSYTSQGGGIGGPSASVNAGVFFADSIESFGGDFNNFSVGGKGMWGADVMWDPSNPAHFGGGVSWGWSGKSVSPVSVTKTTTTLAPKGR